MEETQFTDKKLSKHYQNGVQYHQRMGFTEKWPEYERFLAGDQWPPPTERTKGLPRPVFNLISYIQMHKKASVMGDAIKMVFTSEEFGEVDVDEELNTAMDGADKFTKFAASAWEKIEQDKLNDEMIMSASNCGSGILHYFWDNNITGGITVKYQGDVRGEFIDPANCFFGDPQCIEVQNQPYILISSRELVEKVKLLARANNIPDTLVSLINEDKDTNDELYDGAKHEMADMGKVTVLTEYFKKDGKVFFKKVCNDVVVVPETDTGLTRYPIAIMTWRPRKKCIYGIGDTEGLIANQKGVNFCLAMMLLSQQQTGWPKILAKPGALKQTITNNPGEVITDYYVGEGDGVKYMNVGSFSANTFGLVDKFIDLTKDLSGANDAAMGIAPGADMSAQAIALLQKSSGVPLEDIKKRFYRCMEDVGRIWEDMWKVKYNLPRNVRVQGEDGEEMMQFTGTDYANSPMSLKIDIGPTSTFSEFNAQGTLDKLYERGDINIVTYLKFSSKTAVPFKSELIKEIQKQMQNQLPMGGAGEMDMINQNQLEGYGVPEVNEVNI